VVQIAAEKVIKPSEAELLVHSRIFMRKMNPHFPWSITRPLLLVAGLDLVVVVEVHDKWVDMDMELIEE
jgi:hypothetical protein